VSAIDTQKRREAAYGRRDADELRALVHGDCVVRSVAIGAGVTIRGCPVVTVASPMMSRSRSSPPAVSARPRTQMTATAIATCQRKCTAKPNPNSRIATQTTELPRWPSPVIGERGYPVGGTANRRLATAAPGRRRGARGCRTQRGPVIGVRPALIPSRPAGPPAALPATLGPPAHRPRVRGRARVPHSAQRPPAAPGSRATATPESR